MDLHTAVYNKGFNKSSNGDSDCVCIFVAGVRDFGFYSCYKGDKEKKELVFKFSNPAE